MSEQIGSSLTFLAFFVNFATLEGEEDLTITVDVRRGATSLVTDVAATELGGGLYEYTLDAGAVDAEGLYSAIFKTTSVNVAQKHLPTVWPVGKGGVENLDAAISSRLAASSAQAVAQAALTAQGYTTTRAGYIDALNGIVANIWSYGTRTLTGFGTLVTDIWAAATRTLTSYGTLIADFWDTEVPGTFLAGSAGYKIGKIGTANAIVIAPAVAADELRIIAGDDYHAADGREITWTLDGVPDLTSATVTFTGAGITKATTTTADTVTMELDDTDTADIEPDVYEFELAAELVGGAMITLVRGVMIVQ